MIALAISLIPAAATSAAETSANTNSDDCKISASYPKRTGLNIAFPLPSTTLSAKKETNLLVLRFSLSDLPNTYSIDELSIRDNSMKSFIREFSNGAATVNVNYSNYVYKSDVSTTRWRTFYRSAETHKFVRQMLVASDAFVDFTNVDGVIFQGPWRSNNQSEELYEAYIMREEFGDDFRPFETAEKKIYSGILMGGIGGHRTYTHEVMHPFGLVDLYSDIQSQNLAASGWSLMASGDPTLFLWERWQLGWLKNDDVLCFDLSNAKLSSPINATLHSKSGINQPRMLVIRLDKFSALVVEIREAFFSSAQALVTYTVDSRRLTAPIRLFGQPNKSTLEDLSYDVFRNYVFEQPDRSKYEDEGLSYDFRHDDWTVYISEASTKHRKIHIWNTLTPKNFTDELISATRSRFIREREILDAKLAAEAKAVAFKKTTITCSKGKLAKKVTAIKPVCPKGFKRK